MASPWGDVQAGSLNEYLANIQALNQEVAGRGIQMPEGEYITATQKLPGGGTVYVSNRGGVFAFDGAQFYGSYQMLQDQFRQGDREFTGIELDPSGNGYTIIGNDGSRYSFNQGMYGMMNGTENLPGGGIPFRQYVTTPIVTDPSLVVPNVPVAQPSPTTQPDPVKNEQMQAQKNAMQTIKSLYPWLSTIGVTDDMLLGWAKDGLSPEAQVGAIRQTPFYKLYFAGISRSDGSMRMNEAQYIQTRDAYDQLLVQYGMKKPGDQWTSDKYQAWFEGEVDPNELKTRLDMYTQIERGGQDLKDAFYVYAGIKPSTDDLYRAVTDPKYRDQLVQQYNQQVTQNPPDYQTYITRATQVGLDRAANALSQLEQSGFAIGDAMSKLQAMDPDQARYLVDALSHGGNPSGPHLSLNELTSAFEYAAIGSAATQMGLALPDQARLEAMRQAGVDRSKALQGYGQFALDKNLLQGMAQRSGQSAFTQSDFEQAVFLQSPDAVNSLRRMQGVEQSAGLQSGVTPIGTNRSGRMVQQGLRVPGQ